MANSTYQEQRDNLEENKCENCSGLGTCDDAGPGDMFFNTWRCPACEGTGLKEKWNESTVTTPKKK